MPILGVKWQVRSIYCKFGVSTRAEAVAHGRRVGLIAD
ncbi:ATP/maltotriose-dependent transcriptional regulator MalT [Cellulomonas soli]|nr:ATP/maltotriose-dependent transcriptional regulator MalT [Cellulomonas soli]